MGLALAVDTRHTVLVRADESALCGEPNHASEYTTGDLSSAPSPSYWAEHTLGCSVIAGETDSDACIRDGGENDYAKCVRFGESDLRNENDEMKRVCVGEDCVNMSIEYT
jgi:hypothetical protein